MPFLSMVGPQISEATPLNTQQCASISRQCIPPYSQGHFGVGETFDLHNTTLPLWEALGVLPVNRVSVCTKSTVNLQILASVAY